MSELTSEFMHLQVNKVHEKLKKRKLSNYEQHRVTL